MNGDLFPFDLSMQEARAHLWWTIEQDGVAAYGQIKEQIEFARRSVGQKVRWMREKREAA